MPNDVINVTPDYVNLVAYAGDTFTINVIVTPPDYTAVDTDCKAQVRPSPGHPEILESFFVSRIPEGFCLWLTGDQTAALCDMGAITRGQNCWVTQSFTGAYDIQVTWQSDGKVQTFARGNFKVEKDVTR